MKTLLRTTLTLPLCVAFLSLVGAIVAGTRFGLPVHFYWRTGSDMLAIVGGLAGLFGAILAPGWNLKLRVFLALGGAVLGAAAALAVALIIKSHPTSVVLASVVTLWGTLLGLWLGWLHGTIVRGLTAGLLLLASIAELSLFFEHPDPAAIMGATGGLLACALLCHAETRRQLLRITRAISAGVFILGAVVLFLISPRFWPATQRYDIIPNNIRSSHPSPTCFSPDGQRALASLDTGIYLWNVEDGQVLNHLPVSRGDIAVAAVCYPTDETPYCVFLDRWGNFARWNAHTSKLESNTIGLARAHLAPEVAWQNDLVLALSSDGRRAAVIDPLEAHKLWEIDFDKQLVHPVRLPDLPPVTVLAWIGSDRVVLGCDGDGSLHLASLLDGDLRVLRSRPSPLARRGRNAARLVVSPDGCNACVLNGDSRLCAGNLQERNEFQPIGGTTGRMGAESFSSLGRYFLWTDREDIVHVWDLAESREVRCYPQHRSVVLEKLKMYSKPITGLAIRPDGKVAMSTRSDGAVCLWNLDHVLHP